MIGRFARQAVSGLIISGILGVVSFRTAQGRFEPPEAGSPGILRATLEPRAVIPTPAPSAHPDVQPVGGALAVPKQITNDGCCPYPQWSADSEWVLFVDSIGSDGPGLYGVPAEGGPATFLTGRIGSFSQDLSLVAYPEAGLVYIERWAIGDRWLVPSQGREVYLSHENEWVAWEYGSTSIQNQDLKQRTIWIASIKGEEARELVTVHGGRFLGWINHGQALLVSGRLSPLSPAGVWRIERESGAGRLLFSTDHPRDVLISPKGEWLALTVAFQADHSKNGLWVMRTDGSGITRLPVYGSYRWRAEGELLVIPYDFEAENPYLWQVSVETNQFWELTRPEDDDLVIANNDWQPSPDGRKIVFSSHADRNLWVMSLPDPPE
ncbi:MAG: hypothetical protein P1P76_06915 [Anaerolineales bacterium]|nr:hypothetical protein [Anaerolineales bacterium]